MFEPSQGWLRYDFFLFYSGHYVGYIVQNHVMGQLSMLKIKLIALVNEEQTHDCQIYQI